MLDKDSLKPVIESIIFASDAPLSLERIMNVLEGEERDTVKAALKELMDDYRSGQRGFYIDEVAGGYQFRTSPEFSPWLRRLFKIGAQKISKAAMESLAIIAYKQPITRGELEAIRGVDSGGVLATLMDKRFIKIVGKKEAPGRPVVYGTTKDFLEMFDLKDLSCLPSLKDIQRTEEEDGLQDQAGGQGTAEKRAPDGAERSPSGEGASGEGRTGEETAEAGGGPSGAEAAGQEDPGAEGGTGPGGPDGEAPEDNSLGRGDIEEEG